LAGISNRMEYLKNLSVSAVWINSVYPSENSDFGYDITNYLDISPTYGTMDDFKNLVQQMHKMGKQYRLFPAFPPAPSENSQV